MPKTAVAAALAALILAAVTPTAQAMPMVPHHTVFAGLSADLQDVSWRRCWRDRWGGYAAGPVGATAGDASAVTDAAITRRLGWSPPRAELMPPRARPRRRFVRQAPLRPPPVRMWSVN